MIDNLDDQKDATATHMADFVRGSVTDEPRAIMKTLANNDNMFLIDFDARANKILIEFLTRKMKATYAEKLRVRFGKILK
jgi:hypothetical protein